MANNRSRSLLGAVFKNFINSFKVTGIKGVYKGDDSFGNKYYEVPADPSRGKRVTKRWFVPTNEKKFDKETMPVEWDAWLRNRRADPPQMEELQYNLNIAAMKKENAANLANKGIETTTKVIIEDMTTKKPSFPTYTEYEVIPGQEATKIK